MRTGPPAMRTCATVLLSLLCFSSAALAGPEAHLLRVDPRTSVQDGSPVLTTVIDLSKSQRVSQATTNCAGLRGDDELDCIADALEKPGSLATPHPFPEKNVHLSIQVGDEDFQAALLSHARFGDSQEEPGVGTAWLLVLDVDDRMSKGFDEAKKLAEQFIDTMSSGDLVNLVFVGDRQIAKDTGWLPRGKAKELTAALKAQESPLRSQGRTRPLLDLLKRAASDSFKSLASPGPDLEAPLHQAMVVISSGFGGGDPATTGPGAAQLSKTLTQGRFADGNTALPKLPIPLISVYSPPKAHAEQTQMARTFMENLANPSIGGFFTVLRDGQSDHVSRIVDTVRTRFANMIIARFRLSCLAPKATQSFSLLFSDKETPIVGDRTFVDVPVGFDPSEWPLDLDRELTRKKAGQTPGVFPGGTVRVFGNFCWGNDTNRPEIYFLPPGEKLPAELGSSPHAAAEIQKRLTALDMRGTAIQANPSFAEFRVPDSDQVLHGEADRRVVRFVIVDSKHRRTSGTTEANVLTLKGGSRPLPIIPLASAGGALLLLLAGLGIFLRRGTRKSTQAPGRSHSPIEESPYVTPAPVSRIPQSQTGHRATLEGDSGRFTVLSTHDLRAGRDGSRCAAVVANAQVSGLHATFRLESRRLLVRDEGSTSGTRIEGALVEPGVWEEVPDGAEISLGPASLRAKLEIT